MAVDSVAAAANAAADGEGTDEGGQEDSPNPNIDLTGGIFNFQQVLDDFYNWSPKETDVAGRELKRTFQASLIDKYANNALATGLARENQALATGAMKDAAMLELANQKEIMADESAYKMAQMGAEYDYQQQFAADQANRQNMSDSLRADLQQGQTKLEGDENRLNIEAQGRVDRDQQMRQLGSEEAQQLRALQGDLDKLTTKGDQDRQQIKAQAFANESLEKVKGTERRKDMMQKTEEETKTAKRQNTYASNLAGKF